jgi:toxin ParE1/3/4
MLAVQPRLGPARPDIAEDLRLFPIQRCVLYRELPDSIKVVRVVHGMRRRSGTG